MGARKQIARRKIRIPPKGQQTKEMKFVGTYNPPILWCLRISVCVWGQLKLLHVKSNGSVPPATIAKDFCR